jgi:SAM-dependent methyltransferase
MNRTQYKTLNQTRRLDARNVQRQGQVCKICGAFSRPFDSVDFFKFCSEVDFFGFGFSGIHIRYFRCQDCGFIFTPDCDDWSPRDFAEFVYNEDYPLTDAEYASVRPNQMAQMMSDRLGPMRDLRILDYGSGSGGFGHRMRARGFQVVDYDPFSSPDRPAGQFDLITCFEVIEHGPSPVALVTDMASFLEDGGTIVFTQPLQPDNIEVLRGNWWYIGPRNGHVSIFTADALALLAAQCGLVFHKGEWLSAFSRPMPSEQSRGILGRIGNAQVCIRISAPGETAGVEGILPEPASSWNSLERTEATRYRWTMSARLVWRDALPPTTQADVKIIVPFVNEITEGFAGRCRIEIGSHSLPVRLSGSHLVAEGRLTTAVSDELALITPEPLTPRELRGANDRRRLGLAIPVYPWLPPEAEGRS